MGLQSVTYPLRRSVPCLWIGVCAASLRLIVFGSVAALMVPGMRSAAHGQTISATTVPLLLPTSIAYDAQGNLYLAETNNHVVRRVDSSGGLTTVAGNGTQGFSGDGGPATAAELDSPAGLAVDAAGSLYVADAHNHRVRRVDAATGIISTVAGDGTAGFSGDAGPATLARLDLPSALAVDGAGNLFIADSANHRIRRVAATTGVISTVAGDGRQGFAGDGGPATAAAIDSPNGLAVDGAGNLYLADTHNHRVRVVRAATGLIATVAGSGAPGFTGDTAAATGAELALPRGLSIDGAGNVYVADSNNQRIRRISPQGTITTVAGDGTQRLAGDGWAAMAASLDTPRTTALSASGLVTVGDTGNERVRQIAPDATIRTIAGLASATAETLALTAPSAVAYGTGSMTATLATTSAATGSVTFFDSTAAGTSALGSVALAGNAATLSTGMLAAGSHALSATYTGDQTHPAAQSAAATLTVSPALLSASANSAGILYGQPIPLFSGSLQGVLPQDAGNVSLGLSTAARNLSPAGSYPIVGALSGAAAGDYVLTPIVGAALTINKAPSTAVISAAALSATAGQPVSVGLHVASVTSGTPTGRVSLLDGGATLASLSLSATGDASFATSSLAAGSHALTCVYAGDENFTGSAAAAQTLVIAPPVPGDFALAATGATSQTVASGSAASFTFTVQLQGAALSSPIALASSALPVGITANFNPAYLPPGGAVTAFTLTIQTSKAAVAAVPMPGARGVLAGLAAVFLLGLPFGGKMRRTLASSCLIVLLGFAVGCGDRVTSSALSALPLSSYPITVSGTATTPAGAVLQHTAMVTLNVQ